MAHSYSDYTISESEAQQRCCPSQCTRIQRINCSPVFPCSPTFINPQKWPHNVTHAEGSNFQYFKPVQGFSLQSGIRSTFHGFDSNQQQEMADKTSGRQYTSQHVLNMIFRQICDILIDISNFPMYEHGVTVSHLMIMLQHSCANYNIILPASITNNFEEFLLYEMTDYVKIEGDLCRYRRPILSVQEESISPVCERAIHPYNASNRSKTSLAAINPRQTLQRYDIMPVIVTKGSCPAKEMERVISKRAENVIYKSTEKKNHLIKVMKKWKEIFVGDVKELISYLRMVDDYFQKNGGIFVWSQFKEVFGDLNKRWEFCDIDLIEMGIINVVALNEEPVLIINPIISEVEFPEVAQLAKKIYNFLSELLGFENSVKMEDIVRLMNFGIKNKKTVKEKYALLWEVLSDSQFHDVFVVDILQKQNKERGFDVRIRLNLNVAVPKYFLSNISEEDQLGIFSE